MDLDQLVKGYTPPENVAGLLDKTPTVLLCGITAAGKDTLQNELLKSNSFTRIITSTTRNPREENGVLEQNGREYYFYSKVRAVEKIKNREYFEVAHVHDNIYGVTAGEIQRIHDEGNVALGDVDYQGVEYFHRFAPSVVAIFIIPPSYDIWYERMKHRYRSEDELKTVLPARQASAIKELQWALDTSWCSLVINDDLNSAVAKIRAITAGHGKEDSAARAVVVAMLKEMRKT